MLMNIQINNLNNKQHDITKKKKNIIKINILKIKKRDACGNAILSSHNIVTAFNSAWRHSYFCGRIDLFFQ